MANQLNIKGYDYIEFYVGSAKMWAYWLAKTMAFDIPLSTLAIMAISLSLALLNSGLNRILISRFVGWNDYRTMQKEMAEWRSQQMAAARANDKKQLEKLKKKGLLVRVGGRKQGSWEIKE